MLRVGLQAACNVSIFRCGRPAQPPSNRYADALLAERFVTAEGWKMLNVKELVTVGAGIEHDQPVVINFIPVAPVLAEIQTQFLTLQGKAGQTAQVFVDAVSRQGGCIAILGWTTAPQLDVVLVQDTRKWPLVLTRHARGDVADAFGLASGGDLGFAILCDAPLSDGPVSLRIALPRCDPVQTVPLVEKVELSLGERGLLPGLLSRQYLQLRSHKVGSLPWCAALDLLPEAAHAPHGCHGFIEGAFGAGHGGVVYGWSLHPEDAVIWLEDAGAAFFPLQDMPRRERRDIGEAFADLAWCGMDAGFIAHMPDIGPTSRVRLRLATPQGVITLAELSGFEVLAPDPLTVAARLFDLDTDDDPRQQRARRVDWPLLAPLITRQQADLVLLDPVLKVFGVPNRRPEVSVIIAQCGDVGLMEHQLMAFARDPGFRAVTELFYVICDPADRKNALRIADLIHRLFGLALTVASTPRRLDTSSARNLASQNAKGQYLLFLDDTVLPLTPSWLEGLLAGFTADAHAGAVGARLLTPEGAITHDGFGFDVPSATGHWIAKDSHVRLPDDMVDGATAEKTSAIDDACFLVCRDVFDSLGGWSTDYLPGLGAGLDLCMALQRKGLRALVCRDVKLIQTSRMPARGEVFDRKAAYLNALRFNDIWAADIDSMLRGDT